MKKRQILEILNSLKKINNEIVCGESLDDDRLSECQNKAILIGNSLEANYDTDKINLIIKILEEYCENIFNLSIIKEDELQIKKIKEEIKSQLNQVEIRILYDLPADKKEVVFLPYKASMWDSLESVWKKADADPDTEAYVIPIPYFDKNPDGSFGEEHYEGELYPEYVPITDYRKYDFEGRHPDEIYIHNPYDEYNILTSVHPYFYSTYLRKYTDKLIYIPYFIVDEIDPDDEGKIEEMESFIDQPGVHNADLVIVQSENMAKIYIKVLTRLLMKRSDKYDEETVKKFLQGCIKGWGSPKVDKIKNTNREDLSIPEEWTYLIKKNDGSLKKVVLYNIGVTSAIEHGEKLLDKLERSFEIFKAHKDSVTLLWRPHPLIETTFKNLGEGLYERYISIKEKYIEEGFGIFDDSADLDRAVILSDAYYGDQSSLVQLFLKADKCVMIENVDV
ncbi:hypothetical protein SAMN05216390_12522 [Lachnospiraceae bacterium KH1T2]|nr:hypothetical protein SAMN05216390_12522 [Lachnospiraceae bacterium KH1T2]